PQLAISSARATAGLTSSLFFFSSRRRHTRSKRDWSSDVWSSDLSGGAAGDPRTERGPSRGRQRDRRRVARRARRQQRTRRIGAEERKSVAEGKSGGGGGQERGGGGMGERRVWAAVAEEAEARWRR